mmetsp:Transcript_27506/g.69325  ORF Transcript_27506/g.69325 Transcript_27506/m.69325 type:complete len:412 (+) Transcript_27506:332-1567(+)
MVFCCCAGSQVQPLVGRTSSAALDPADHVTKEVRRQKIVLNRTTKLPGCFRTMVLQEFPGWNPLPTIHVALLFFLISACVFLILGILATNAALSVNEIRVRYDNVGALDPDTNTYPLIDADGGQQLLGQLEGEGYWLNLTFNVSQRMPKPVYLFYYIKGFYGGHRRYIRSRSNMQLAGVSDLEATDPKCRPQLYNTPDDEPSTEGVMPGQGLITPCGLLAWSQFNDSFVLHDKDIQQDIAIDESDLAWRSDADLLYSDRNATNFNTYEQRGLRGGANISTPLNEAQHFMLWMRPTATPDLYHLWGKIDRDLEAGTQLRLRVQNRYNTYGWEGEKGVVLTTNSWMGGGNMFNGIYCIVLGGLYLIASIVLLLSYIHKSRRKQLAAQELSWQRNPASTQLQGTAAHGLPGQHG